MIALIVLAGLVLALSTAVAVLAVLLHRRKRPIERVVELCRHDWKIKSASWERAPAGTEASGFLSDWTYRWMTTGLTTVTQQCQRAGCHKIHSYHVLGKAQLPGWKWARGSSTSDAAVPAEKYERTREVLAQRGLL